MSDDTTPNGSDEPFTHSPYGKPSETPNPYAAPETSSDATAPYSSGPYGQSQFNPTSAQPSDQTPPNAYGQGAYGQGAYGQTPYGQTPAYGQAQYGQSPYGYGYPMNAQVDHPQGTTVLVLGIVGLLFCQLVSPFAWVIGGRARREAKASPGRYSNEGLITAGWVMGIVGTVLIVVMIVAFIAVFVIAGLAANDAYNTYEDSYNSTY